MVRFLNALLLASIVAGTAMANSVGSDFNLFNPAVGVKDFITVESGKNMKSGRFGLGLSVDYASNSLPYGAASVDSSKREGFSDDSTLVVAHVQLALGILDAWELGLTLPIVVSQKYDSSRGNSKDPEGLLEARIQTKFNLVDNDSFALALVGRANLNQADENPFVGNDPDPSYSAELAMSAPLGSVVDLGINAGYMWRGEGELANRRQELGNSIVASLGLGFNTSDNSKVVVEYYTDLAENSNSEVDNLTDRKLDSQEVLVGFNHRCSEDFSYNAGLGTELSHGVGSADMRVFVGMNYVMGGDTPEMVAPAPKPMPLPAPTPVLVVKEPAPEPEIITVRDIKFKTGSAKLGGDAGTQAAIEKAVNALKGKSFESIEIAGHTDSTGSEALNKRLSQKRADAVRKKVISLGGFAASKIKAVGYGQSQPIGDNSTVTGRAQNRRVEFKINQ